MQECKTFLKVIFYIQIIVHLCEGKILNNYSSSKRLLSHITVLQFLCFKGSHEKNLPPLITSVFEAEYFVPVAYSYPFSLHCKAENGIIRYMYLLYFYKLNWFLEEKKFSTKKLLGPIFFLAITDSNHIPCKPIIIETYRLSYVHKQNRSLFNVRNIQS